MDGLKVGSCFLTKDSCLSYEVTGIFSQMNEVSLIVYKDGVRFSCAMLNILNVLDRFKKGEFYFV